MHTSLFFRLFPPPKFMVMRYGGMDISDDAIHYLEYSSSPKGFKISKYAKVDLAPGIVEAGEIKDGKKLKDILIAFDNEHDITHVKVSLPEEKMYLFQADVPSMDATAVRQNIESKLEENVPLAAPDAVFYFNLLSPAMSGGSPRASVSVAPRVYVEEYIALLRSAGISPVAFEAIPKAIARAIVPHHDETTRLIIYMMKGKTGIYIVSGDAVCFTSTIADGTSEIQTAGRPAYIEALSKEINRVYAYWVSRGGSHPPISAIFLAGSAAPALESALQGVVVGADVPVKVVSVWQNVFNLDHYVPPIAHDESLDYIVAAGLAMDS